jgi:hypothetical protein
MPLFILLMLIVGFAIVVVLTAPRSRELDAEPHPTKGDAGVMREDDVVV